MSGAAARRKGAAGRAELPGLVEEFSGLVRALLGDIEGAGK